MSELDENGFLKTDAPVVDTPPEHPDNAQQTEAPADQPPIKRKRGRPRKDGSTGAPQVEGIDGSSLPPRPTRAKKKQAYSAEDVKMMGKQIAGLHIVVSQMTGIPELQIQEAEGQMLAQSIVNVCDQYDLAIDGKTGAFIQLIGVAGIVYAPRFMHFRSRMAKAEQEKKASNSAASQPINPYVGT